ncbi:MAG TPA: YdcF family protein [Actinospica sp.]|jgi:hypothetical protein|nr:YdcF family protein [Actinospica sp.]
MAPSNHELRLGEALWDYLRLGQPVESAEWILVFGSHDLTVAHRAADLYHNGTAPRLLVSGGSRALPAGAGHATEAEALREILIERGVPEEAIALERLASNTSENFWFSAELLRDQGVAAERFLVVQKPYAERRIIATARRRWPNWNVRVTSRQTSFAEYCAGDIPALKIISMLVGEIQRLDAYSRAGLIQAEATPGTLLDAARHLADAGFDARALA